MEIVVVNNIVSWNHLLQFMVAASQPHPNGIPTRQTYHILLADSSDKITLKSSASKA